jgi:hypothetical protein
MREPKTPLPWRHYEHDPGVIGSDEHKDDVAEFWEDGDAAYAVHAANVLPEVLAALETAFRSLVALTGETEEQDRFRRLALDKIEAALAKAEGADETPRER